MDTKIRPIYKPTGDPLQTQRYIHTESKRMEKKIFHANGNQKKVGVAILILDKISLIKNIIRDKERHYIMIKESIQDIAIVKVYAANIGAPHIYGKH